MTRSTPARVLGLVADDLTGAADSAVAFADHGWRVILHLHPERLQQQPAAPQDAVPTVLAVTTSCRACSDEEAAAVTARAVEIVRGAGAQRLYLKIDSTVRGSVAGQIKGAQRAWGSPDEPARAIICPAFPSQGRTVIGGRVQVHGLPLEQTAAATDPITPRHTGDLRTILPGAVSGDPAGQQPLLIADAADDHDLDALAGQLAAAPDSTIAVGSGGLAAAVARRSSLVAVPARPATSGLGSGRILVAISSLHPVTAGQVSRLHASSDVAPVDVLTSGGETTTADEAAANLAARVDAALADHTYSALVIVGGDGAAAILNRADADHLLVDGATHPGCPSGIIIGGRADGLRLVTKSGGFGDPDTLRSILTLLRRGSDPDRSPRHDPARPTTTKEAS